MSPKSPRYLTPQTEKLVPSSPSLHILSSLSILNSSVGQEHETIFLNPFLNSSIEFELSLGSTSREHRSSSGHQRPSFQRLKKDDGRIYHLSQWNRWERWDCISCARNGFIWRGIMVSVLEAFLFHGAALTTVTFVVQVFWSIRYYLTNCWKRILYLLDRSAKQESRRRPGEL